MGERKGVTVEGGQGEGEGMDERKGVTVEGGHSEGEGGLPEPCRAEHLLPLSIRQVTAPASSSPRHCRVKDDIAAGPNGRVKRGVTADHEPSPLATERQPSRSRVGGPDWGSRPGTTLPWL